VVHYALVIAEPPNPYAAVLIVLMGGTWRGLPRPCSDPRTGLRNLGLIPGNRHPPSSQWDYSNAAISGTWAL